MESGPRVKPEGKRVWRPRHKAGRLSQIDPKIITAQIDAQHPQVRIELDLAGDAVNYLGRLYPFESALKHQPRIIPIAGRWSGCIERARAVEMVDLDENLSRNRIATSRNDAHFAQVIVAPHKHATP